MKDKLDETGVALKVIHELANERWDVCLTLSEKGFQQISFVNSIATTKVSVLISCFQVRNTLSLKGLEQLNANKMRNKS